MTDSDERPQKRVRLDDPSSLPAITSETATSVPAESSKATEARLSTPQAPPPAKLSDYEREIKAGITEYVSANLGFSGVFKQRYTDFLVNEIGLDGRVLHLTKTGVKKESKPAKNSSNGDSDVKMVDADIEGKKQGGGHPIEGTDSQALSGQIEKAGSEKNGDSGKKKEEENKVSDADLQILHSLFGEPTTSEVIRLVHAIRKDPERKAKDFTAITTAPMTDKENRTLAHETLRRVFPNMLQSSMESDQTLRIKASPPVNRDNRKKGGGRDRDNRDPDRHRGKVAWEERGGEFLHFTLYKENKDTMEIIGFLGSVTGGGTRAYGYAGTKDRRACTAQRVCVKRQTAERMTGIAENLRNAALGDYEYKKHDLRLGDLLGNEFTITLRDCRFEKEEDHDATQRVQLANDIVSRSVKGFSENGFINYYGLQRFGTFAASTDSIGVKLLQENFKGAIDELLAYSEASLAAANSKEENPAVLISQDDKMRAKGLHIWKTKKDGNHALQVLPRKLSAERNIIQHLNARNKTTRQHDRLTDYQGALMTIPRNLRLMYVHAYQSLVWNVVASKRWTTYGSKVVEGDLVLVHEHKDKEGQHREPTPDTIDQDGEMIINPSGDDSAIKDEDRFERARPLTKQEAESGSYTIWDVVLPQPGYDVEYPRNEIGDFYKEFMGSERGGGLDPHNMRRKWREISLSGGYRKFLARPLQPLSFTVHEYTNDDAQFVETDLERLQKNDREPVVDEAAKESNEDAGETQNEAKKIAVVIKLQLGSSQYATVALRELMKAGGVQAFQPQFMGGR